MTNSDDDLMLSAYVIPNDEFHPQRYFKKLIELQEHRHLLDGEVVVDFLLVREPVIKQGRQVLGAVHMPSVQGQLKGVFTWMFLNTFGRLADFLVLLDKDFWMGECDRTREILMYHEMCHMVHKVDGDGEPRFNESGKPVFGLQAHDVEEFANTVKRYGAYSAEIEEFITAAQVGGRHE